MGSLLQNCYQKIGDDKKDPRPGKSLSNQVHREKLVSTCGVIPETGPKFLDGPSRGALHFQETEEGGWKA